MSLLVVNIILTKYYHQLKMLQTGSQHQLDNPKYIQIKAGLCWGFGVLLSLPEVFAWDSLNANGSTDCTLLAFFGQDHISKHLSGSELDLDGLNPYPVRWWEIRCYHVYIGTVSC